MSRLWILPALGLIAALGVACGDDDQPTATSPAASVSSVPPNSPTPTAHPSLTSSQGASYTDDQFKYQITLPTGWRFANSFTNAYRSLNAQPQGLGAGQETAVMTSLSAQEESMLLAQAQGTPTGLTGIESWLDFFLHESVEIYPTHLTQQQVLGSVVDGNVKHVVTNVQSVQVAGGTAGTRFDLELQSDYGHFVYDTVFVAASVKGCSGCSGFILQTAVSGRSSLQSPGPVEPPAASYPKNDFEAIFSTFAIEP
jgi:hypothetical protein